MCECVRACVRELQNEESCVVKNMYSYFDKDEVL